MWPVHAVCVHVHNYMFVHLHNNIIIISKGWPGTNLVLLRHCVCQDSCKLLIHTDGHWHAFAQLM